MMTTQKIRRSIHELVDQTSNPAVLKAYHAILKNLLEMEEKMPVAYTLEGQPLDESEYIREIVEASQRVKAGKFIKQEDLEKEVSAW